MTQIWFYTKCHVFNNEVILAASAVCRSDLLTPSFISSVPPPPPQTPPPFQPTTISVPHPGPDRHAGGAGDLLRAAAAQAAEEDVLREEGEAPGPHGHPGARPPVLHHRVQEDAERGQGPSVRQLHHSGVPQRRSHDRLVTSVKKRTRFCRAVKNVKASCNDESRLPNISSFSR